MTADIKRPLIVITGPTASGKTGLSVRIAKALSGEIVSADSMQLYRYMDIGTAKIREDEKGGIPHHLIDVLEPTQECNVYRFRDMVKEAVSGIYERGRIPILAGGTGFYIRAIVYDTAFEEEKDEGTVRKRLMEEADTLGPHALWERLNRIDPESALMIHENNIKRVIRALEYNELTGGLISEHNRREKEREAAFDHITFVLTMDRSLLYERINRRVDQMIEEGLVDEVKNLMDKGLADRSSTAMQAIGYREIYDHLTGSYSLDRAVYLIKQNTRHFAKRQLTWFRMQRDVTWIDNTDLSGDRAYEQMMKVIEERWGKIGTDI